MSNHPLLRRFQLSNCIIKLPIANSKCQLRTFTKAKESKPTDRKHQTFRPGFAAESLWPGTGTGYSFFTLITYRLDELPCSIHLRPKLGLPFSMFFCFSKLGHRIQRNSPQAP